MNKYFAFFLISALAGIFTTGCTHQAGNDFQIVKTNNIQLGKTTNEQARRMFGDPKVEKNVSNDYNDYNIWSYIFVESRSFNQSDGRIMVLEFVDNTLNGYFYASTFDSDAPPQNLRAKNKINRQSSTRADVARILGVPDGKAYANTTLEMFQEGVGEEIWLYQQETEEVDNSIVSEKILVGFDRDGVVETVTSSKTKLN